MCKVSVIIPCYNQGKYLEETLQSVQAQSFTDWEIIIVNDGSDDAETKALLNRLDLPKVTIIHTENKGVASARNTGIKAANGIFILPLDGDDLIGIDYLKEAVACLQEEPEVKVVYCNAEYFEGETGLIKLPDYNPKTMLQQNLIFCTALYRKEDWLQSAGYDESFMTGWEDWEFWLRFIENKKQVHKLNKVHFYYRIKKESRNAGLQNDKLQQAEQQLYNKHIELYKKFYPNPVSLIRNYEDLLCEHEQYEKYKKELAGSLSYRIGNFILYPLKKIAGLARSAK